MVWRPLRPFQTARYEAWEYAAWCGANAQDDVVGQAPRARALELRVRLPAVASMYQINNIRSRTTTLSLSLAPDVEQWRQKMFAARLSIPLPGACDPGAVRAHWAARARTLCVLLPLQSAPTGPLHTSICIPRSILPTRLFASPPRDATPEGLCALHRSPLGSTVTCAADGFHVGGIFAALVPALVDADARTAAVTPSLPPSKPAAINAVFPQEAEGDDDFERRHVDNVEPKGRPTQDERTAAVTPSLPPSKPAAINAVFPQEAEGDDDFERRRGDDVAPKCRHLDSVSAAACPQRLPRTRRGTRGGRSKTKWLLTQRPLCPPT